MSELKKNLQKLNRRKKIHSTTIKYLTSRSHNPENQPTYVPLKESLGYSIYGQNTFGGQNSRREHLITEEENKLSSLMIISLKDVKSGLRKPSGKNFHKINSLNDQKSTLNREQRTPTRAERQLDAYFERSSADVYGDKGCNISPMSRLNILTDLPMQPLQFHVIP